MVIPQRRLLELFVLHLEIRLLDQVFLLLDGFLNSLGKLFKYKLDIFLLLFKLQLLKHYKFCDLNSQRSCYMELVAQLLLFEVLNPASFFELREENVLFFHLFDL